MPEVTIGLRRRGATTNIVVSLLWDEVAEVLGHEHSGSALDCETLCAWLAANGGPEWVATAPDWVDEERWGLTGPEVSEAEVQEFEQAYSPAP